MDSKTLHVLEYPKVLARLVGFCDFSASMELARAPHPIGYAALRGLSPAGRGNRGV